MLFIFLIFILLAVCGALRISELGKKTAELSEDIEELRLFFEEPEAVPVASVEELEELRTRVEQLELGDIPRFDDKLTEGLQNLMDYSVEIARGGMMTSDR